MPFIETKARYENTTMREIQNKEGNLIGYDIAPIDGYVLHNIAFDEYEYDPEVEVASIEESENSETKGELISRGYSPSSCSVEADYDFEANPSEIYAKKRDDIEENEVIY